MRPGIQHGADNLFGPSVNRYYMDVTRLFSHGAHLGVIIYCHRRNPRRCREYQRMKPHRYDQVCLRYGRQRIPRRTVERDDLRTHAAVCFTQTHNAVGHIKVNLRLKSQQRDMGSKLGANPSDHTGIHDLTVSRARPGPRPERKHDARTGRQRDLTTTRVLRLQRERRVCNQHRRWLRHPNLSHKLHGSRVAEGYHLSPGKRQPGKPP